ncbi:DUF4139 domain-containing protein [Paenibacillus roseipurpureus]|uniref:DUF4139 domain-containing protein n=1 Tax=Paenibacillus roseopurpureus TaxID=2918901 RepID=A0AA96RL95_9BACL|nr:hypothetical protein [Paenibacillus sp. MBLB1832]WNR45154.1 hypothetical protein MJB10_03095 [Paenibacillus sp. MBLB1832]
MKSNEHVEIFTLTSNDNVEVALTIYNNNFGAVKEKRRASSLIRQQQINYLDVAATIETESILVKGIEILEMNYEYDLVNKSKLLEKYLGHTVFLQRNSRREEYRLLSISHGVVLEHVDSGEILLDPKDELILPKLPHGLIIRPAIKWKIRPSESEQIEVSYLTKGFSWNVNYVMNLKGDQLSLAGWVNIKNESGATFSNAKIKLIAGEVKRVFNEVDLMPVTYHSDATRIMESRIPFEEREFADYHLYVLQECTTLKNEQSKQIRLFQVDNVPCQVYYECRTGWKRANIIVTFQNIESSNLGFPLPMGTIKVYQEDHDSQNEFIGEDAIDHTPKNEIISLNIGEAFDLVLEHQRKEIQRVGRGHTAESHEIIIRNTKNESAQVKLSHHVYQRFWRISDTSHPYDKNGSNTVIYNIYVSAGTEVVVRFTVEMDEKQMLYFE